MPDKGKTYYLYKDRFLSGWGKAPSGSYVITEGKPIKRDEFKFIASSRNLQTLAARRLRGKGKHMELWRGIRSQIGRPKVTKRLIKVKGRVRQRVPFMD